MQKLFLGCIFLLSAMITIAQKNNTEAIKQVLGKYQAAIEKLDTAGVANLFTKNSIVYEQGSDEGTAAHYMEHHLGPEFKEFSSFKFSEYKVDIKLAGAYAFTAESYTYTIVLAKDGKESKSKGITTSVLQKTKEGWKILQSHNSFRRAK